MKENSMKPCTGALGIPQQGTTVGCRKLEFLTVLSCHAICFFNEATRKIKGIGLNKTGQKRFYLLDAKEVELLHTCVLPNMRRLTL